MDPAIDAPHRLQGYSSPFVEQRVEHPGIELVNGWIHSIVDATRLGCFDIRVLKDDIGEEDPAMVAKNAEQFEDSLKVIVDPGAEVAIWANTGGQQTKLPGEEREDAVRIPSDHGS